MKKLVLKLIKPLIDIIGDKFKSYYLQKYRLQINADVYNYYDGIIQSGIFKGQKILPYVNTWSKSDFGSIVLGIYELEVQNFLKKHLCINNNLIVMGAADGHFAINCLLSFDLHSVICYELSSNGRENIMKNAEHFDLKEKIEIRKEINKDEMNKINFSSNDLLICDIEGGEFDIFEEPILEKLKNSKIIIEIHSKNIDNYNNKLNNLISNASKFFHVDELVTGSRDLSKFIYSKDVPDDKRWMICSEGRSKLGKWLTLTPKK